MVMIEGRCIFCVGLGVKIGLQTCLCGGGEEEGVREVVLVSQVALSVSLNKYLPSKIRHCTGLAAYIR